MPNTSRTYRSLRRRSSRLSEIVLGVVGFDGCEEEEEKVQMGCCASRIQVGSSSPLAIKALGNAVLAGLRARAQTDPPRLEGHGGCVNVYTKLLDDMGGKD